MYNLKFTISIIAIILTIVGYVPYIRDILLKKTSPHIFSWFIWSIITGVIFALQISHGAGVGSLVTLMVAIISGVIFFLGLKSGNKNIKTVDIIFLIFALLAIPLWLVVKQPLLSIILLTIIDMLAFAPTVRKSWGDPYSETLSLYVFAAIRHGLGIVALFEYNFITSLFPVSWVVANSLFVIMLVYKRREAKRRI